MGCTSKRGDALRGAQPRARGRHEQARHAASMCARCRASPRQAARRIGRVIPPDLLCHGWRGLTRTASQPRARQQMACGAWIGLAGVGRVQQACSRWPRASGPYCQPCKRVHPVPKTKKLHRESRHAPYNDITRYSRPRPRPRNSTRCNTKPAAPTGPPQPPLLHEGQAQCVGRRCRTRLAAQLGR